LGDSKRPTNFRNEHLKNQTKRGKKSPTWPSKFVNVQTNGRKQNCMKGKKKRNWFFLATGGRSPKIPREIGIRLYGKHRGEKKVKTLK